MQTRLLSREAGDVEPHEFTRWIYGDLVHAFAAAPQHRFNGEMSDLNANQIRAHGAGVSGLALDKFDGRILVSGGSEGSLKIWDLEETTSSQQRHMFRPVSTIGRRTGSGGHSHGITHVAFYPFDADAFLSSSYDKSLKVWATQTAGLRAEFDLNATIYSHSMSPVAGHVLVSCATQHSNVRLVDLKSGSAVQALVAHGGPVLCSSWSPGHQHILASGHADGKVRIWDIRRAGGVVALLDQEDSVGVVGEDRVKTSETQAQAQAHDDAVNALQWTDDGKYIVSAGLDGKIRVWDAATGANTLASFGASIRNRHARTASMVVLPSGLVREHQLLVWPNDQEILILDLHQGSTLTRLRTGGAGSGSSTQNNRITAVAWRGCGGGVGQTGCVMGGGNSVGGIYSAHLDGQIRAWMPQMPGPDDVDETETENQDEEVRRRKRKAVDSAYRSLMGRQITFTGR